jgi:hypothetical protein
LTNYSLNKNNKDDFDKLKHKLRVQDVLNGTLSSKSPSGKVFSKSSAQIWQEMEDVIIKTILII